MKQILLFSFLILLTACGNKTEVSTLPDPVPDQKINASEEGLSLTLLENTFTGSPAMIQTQIQNDSPIAYTLGDFYHIEIEKDGQWYMITYSDAVFFNNPDFKDFGKTLAAGEEVYQDFHVKDLDVKLQPGNYRLVKTFLSQGESFYEVSIAVYFFVK